VHPDGEWSDGAARGARLQLPFATAFEF